MNLSQQERDAQTTPRPVVTSARASLVNRVHRVVRAEAAELRARRQQRRSLWVPVGIFSALMVSMLYAIWAMLDGYDLTPNGVPDASDQMMLLLLWSVPVTAVVLGLAWLQRDRAQRLDAGERPR